MSSQVNIVIISTLFIYVAGFLCQKVIGDQFRRTDTDEQ